MPLFGYQFGIMSGKPSSGGGALPGFDFASVGTPELWLDARDSSTIVESGGVVSSWANRIPAKPVTTVTESIMANRPLLVTSTHGALPAIQFGSSGTVHLFSTATPVATGPIYMYALLARTGSPASTMGIMSAYDSGMTTGTYTLELNTSFNGQFTSLFNTATTTNTVTTAQNHIVWGRQQAPGDTVEAGIDGGSQTSIGTIAFPTTDNFIIGNDATANLSFQGEIIIALVYSALTEMEHSDVILGLAAIGGVP